MNSEEEPTFNRLPPGFLIRSFSVIVIGYLGFLVVLLAIGLGVGVGIEGGAFVDQFREENFDQANPPTFDEVYSKTSAWLILALSSVMAIGAGYLVARMAQFVRFGHGVLLSVLFVVTFVRLLLSEDPWPPTWLTIAMLGFIPAATLFGAKYCEIRMLVRSGGGSEAGDSSDMAAED